MINLKAADNLYTALTRPGMNWGFEGSHNIRTPRPLVNEILNQIDLQDKTILALFNVEWVFSLIYEHGIEPDKITFYSDHTTKTEIAQALKVEVISNLMTNRKFDIVVGNPPFSKINEGKTHGKRSVELYKKFFMTSLDIADVVAMIMPSSNTKVQRTHNAILRNKANVIKHIDPKVFPSITMPMWYVIIDSNNSNRCKDIEWTLESTGNTINWTKGSVNMTHYKNLTGGHGYSEKINEDDVTIFHKINGTVGVVKAYGPRSSFTQKQLFPSKGFAVLMPQTFHDNGWSRIEVVECTGNEAAFNGVNIVFTSTLAEAQDLIKIMNTKNFIDGANKVKQGFNNMNLTCLRSIVI